MISSQVGNWEGDGRIDNFRENFYCTSRQKTLRVYVRQGGGLAIHRQFLLGGSCAFATPVRG